MLHHEPGPSPAILDTNELSAGEEFSIKPLEALTAAEAEAAPQLFSIQPRGERRIDAVAGWRGGQERNRAKSVDFDRILSERLSSGGGGEAIKLVNTIEYKASDYKGETGADSWLSISDEERPILGPRY